MGLMTGETKSHAHMGVIKSRQYIHGFDKLWASNHRWIKLKFKFSLRDASKTFVTTTIFKKFKAIVTAVIDY